LWNNKSRTLQVVLIIAMGAFAVGMILGSSDLIRKGLTSAWRASSPAMIYLTADPPVDDETIQALRGERGIEDVEGYLQANIEWRLDPAGEWKPATLYARDDYKEQKYATVNLVKGDWPSRSEMAVLQGAEEAFGLPIGSRVYLRVNDHQYQIRVGGVVYSPLGVPPAFGGNPEFYATRDRFSDMTGERNFNNILAAAPVFDEAAVTELADRIERQLEKQDIEAVGAPVPGRVSNPNKHFFQDVMDGIFFVLGFMAVMTLLLGLLLVYNTINAIVTQQVNQIGIMKAIGARTRQIIRLYLTMVLVYGFLSLLLAVPLGALAAYGMSAFLLSAFNVIPGPFTISTTAVIAQALIAVLAPLLASLIPVLSGAGITVREAIATYGLNAAAGRFSRWLAGLERVSRLMVMIISNTFRNRGRVILTQITLVGSGLIFMMVMSVRDSANYTFGEVLFDILKFNVSLQFESPERIREVESLTLAQPGVKAVEMWAFQGATLRPAGSPESNEDESVSLFGMPLPTQLYGPQVRAGRWLRPDDTYAVVLNQDLAEDAGVGVGDTITLNQNLYGESDWLVVGLVFDMSIPNGVYMKREVLLREMRSVGKTSTVWIQTFRTDAAGEAEVATKLRRLYEQKKLEVSPANIFGSDTASQIVAQIQNNFGIILTLLAAVAIVMGMVGAMGLSGALSLSVLERRREIGVMRAIGASSLRIATLFIGEGLALGLLSWLIALPFSIPAGYGMSQALGMALQGEIIFHFTMTGPLYWLIMITILSIGASWLPARTATQISVRESLAYQ
jgi:putative ABC transport system permease protein